jgi:serine/threonine-protein kinase
MEYKPTDDLDAYDLYLRGKEYWDSKNYELAIPLLESAVEADADFAEAHSLLARIHGFVYFNMLDRTEERLQLCEDAARNAVRASYGGIEGHIGMGYFYYYCKQDYDRALVEYKSVMERQPNNGDALRAIGFVQRRQGKWEQAADNLSKALKIDPHSQMLASSLILTLGCKREHKETLRILDRTLSLWPDASELLFFKANTMLMLGADTTEVRPILDRAARYGDPVLVAYWMEGFDILFRDYESAINRRMVPGEYILANSAEYYLSKADAYRFWGRDSLSIVYYDSARLVSERRLEADPDMAFYHSTLATAYAGLGRFSDGIREGKKAVELMPTSLDAMYGPMVVEELAIVYVMAGKYDLAMDLLDTLVSIPAGTQIYDLRHHPRWDPLRDHPRFQALIEKYEKEYGTR